MKKKWIAMILSAILIVNYIPLNAVQAYDLLSNKSVEYNDNRSILDVNIISNTPVTVEQAKVWARSKNATSTFISLADIYWNYSSKRGGVNPALAYVQAAKETGYGKFTGVLDESYHNPCGMKVTEGGGDKDPNAHKKFDNWEQGVQAQLDHLALYAGATNYPKSKTEQSYVGELKPDSTYDVRHFKNLYNTARTATQLSGKWAAGTYGSDIVKMYNDLLINSGNLQSGWYKENSNWYYVESNGSLTVGWKQLGNDRYYFKPDGVMVVGIYEIDGKKYNFGQDGKFIGEVSKSGWVQESGKWYYYQTNGEKAKEWLSLGGYKFYLGSDGVMRTGWQDIEGSRYYFKSDGAMVVGIYEIAGKKYNFGQDGKLLGEVFKSGWVQESGKWYYYKTNGEKAKGWLSLGGYKFYLNEEGVMQTGLKLIEGSIYYFDASGAMKKSSTVTINKVEYKFNEAGKLIKEDWIVIEGKWYFNKSTGEIQKNWLSRGGYKFYLGSDGVMRTGWQDIEGSRY